jgi:Carboxypeptidase regulatory-like domain
MHISLKSLLALFFLLFVAVSVPSYNLFAQSLGNTGTVQGTVTDPSGAVVPGAAVTITNVITGYTAETKTAGDGSFRFNNLPPNPYRVDVHTEKFAPSTQRVEVSGAIPVQVAVKLNLAGASTTVEVTGVSEALELDPGAHVDTDRSVIQKIPTNPGEGLSDAITFSTGGVAADGNGFFHPQGDHAQYQFSIDNQPITDQQSKVFSTQLPVSAIQGMEIDTGFVNAEFGDKTSLVAQITTRSGLGTHKLFGDVTGSYGSFGTANGGLGIGYGNDKWGNFLAIDGVRSGHFLDTPEFRPIHDIGNNETFFDRVDYQLSPKDILHLNLFAARNWIQIPNDFDQLNTFGNLSQDQRQKVVTWNIAPAYQHIFNPDTLLSANLYVREDQFNYYPSKQIFADLPLTQGQSRHLFNYGIKSDLSKTKGRHNLKFGIDLKQTRLLENFNFGITDPTFNAPCLNADGTPDGDPTQTDPSQCTGTLTANPGFNPLQLPFDLSRGGAQFLFHATHNINQYGFYAQDSIRAGNFLFNLGIRGDMYYGVSSGSQPEPRIGIAYNVKKTGTVLRVAYARTFETPFNENLLLAASPTAAIIDGAPSATPIQPGFRNQFNAGLQQAVGKWILVDADYFWKYTHNAYDFNTLLSTTITFPIAWHNSKLDGLNGRVSTVNIHGFQAFYTFGHTRARYFPPEVGGFTPFQPASVFRIDHDQAFQNTLNLRYQHKNREFIDWIWRYDSGLVVSGVPDVSAALALTPNQQVDLGLTCDGVRATLANPFTPTTPCNVGTSTLITLPQTGKEDDDHNPDRVKPRSILDANIGSDNLFHSEGPRKFVASLSVINLTNKVALYNFLSTFSGTHFVQPRTFTARFGFTF